MSNMTSEECQTFCQAAALGVTLGLEHRYEWYVNAQRCLSHGVYTEIEANSKKINDAFLAFEKRLASCPEEELFYTHLEIGGFNALVNEFYKKARERQE